MDQRGVFVGRGVAKFDFGRCMTSVPRRAGAFDDAHLLVLSATSKLMPDSGTLWPRRGFAVKGGQRASRIPSDPQEVGEFDCRRRAREFGAVIATGYRPTSAGIVAAKSLTGMPPFRV